MKEKKKKKNQQTIKTKGKHIEKNVVQT